MRTHGMKHQLQAMKLMEGRRTFALLMEQGCVDKDTEYLSPEGWRKISDYEDGLVAQYNPDSCDAEFVQPEAFVVKDCSEFYHYKSPYGLDQMLSGEHRMLLESSRSIALSSRKNIGRTAKGKCLFEAHAEEIAALPERVFSHVTVPNRFHLKADGRAMPLTEAQLRVQVAFNADGTYGRRDLSGLKPTTKGVVRIKKQRKKDRLRNLLSEAQIQFVEREIANGFSTFTFSTPLTLTKNYDGFWGCSPQQLNVILDECKYWDGTDRGDQFCFFTSRRGDADFIQYCAVATNRRARVVCVSETEFVVNVARRAAENNSLKKPERILSPGAKKYCFEVESGFLVFRREGCVFCSGNTGKTWTLLADAERLYAKGAIDAVLVVAPNGVHTNWVTREIPTHMEGDIIARAWRSGAGVRYRKHLDEIMRPRDVGVPVPLRILAVNIDALITKPAFDFAMSFVRATKCLLVLDESHRIKNPKSSRTIALMKLRPHCSGARIATGTPITNAPTDLFAQFELLASGLLGTTSHRAFVAEYADVLPATHPLMQNMIRQNPRSVYAQVIAKNSDGSPRWRNLDKLQALITPHSFRVLKSECLDLPPKVYKTISFELDAAQRKAYDKMRDDLRIELPDSTELPVEALAALTKLQQITSGFVNLPEKGGLQLVSESNPRLKALLDLVEDVDGKFIVWARFKEELRALSEALRAAGIETVEYHGDVSKAYRELAIEALQTGTARAFVAQAQAGGTGLTLTAAETAIYYSNDFNSGTRLQSEDRNHRIGTKSSVLYIDLVAEGTLDERIAAVLQRKKFTAATVLGD